MTIDYLKKGPRNVVYVKHAEHWSETDNVHHDKKVHRAGGSNFKYTGVSNACLLRYTQETSIYRTCLCKNNNNNNTAQHRFSIWCTVGRFQS
jgi:hypothetical protein